MQREIGSVFASCMTDTSMDREMHEEQKCTVCARKIASHAVFCRHCGAPHAVQDVTRRRRLTAYFCLALWLLLAVIMLVGPPFAFGRDSRLEGAVLERARRGAKHAQEGAEAVMKRLEALLPPECVPR